MQNRSRQAIGTVASAVFACAFSAGSAVATEDVQLTTVSGQASVADAALTQRAELPEDQDVKTGDDGNMSVLVDRNAVVEMCGRSRVRFGRNDQGGNRIINIEAGEVKLVVEPRSPGERIEIHTPAAVATILGTVVYVSVDPVTGATTISSSQSQVNIRSKDASGDPGTTISAYEQLTVVPGQQQQEKRQIDEQQVASLSSCLLNFHDLAVEVDRIPLEVSVAERVAAADIADLPSVEAGPDAVPADTDVDAPEAELDVFDANQMEEMMAPPPVPRPPDIRDEF